jgi:hypothetical protein
MSSEEIYKKWIPTRLMNGLPEDCNSHLSFQAQVDLNEADGVPYGDNVFRRISIPLVRRIYGHIPLGKIEGSLTPVSEDWIHVSDYNPPAVQLDGRGYSLSYEAEYIVGLSKSIADFMLNYGDPEKKIIFHCLKFECNDASFGGNKVYANFLKVD